MLSALKTFVEVFFIGLLEESKARLKTLPLFFALLALLACLVEGTFSQWPEDYILKAKAVLSLITR